MTAARRIRSRYPNIFCRETPKGRAYEISFYNHARRRRWERVPGFDNIDAAVELLADRQGKRRRGERTAPTSVRFTDVAQRYLDSRRFAQLGGWTQKNYRAGLRRRSCPTSASSRSLPSTPR